MHVKSAENQKGWPPVKRAVNKEQDLLFLPFPTAKQITSIYTRG